MKRCVSADITYTTPSAAAVCFSFYTNTQTAVGHLTLASRPAAPKVLFTYTDSYCLLSCCHRQHKGKDAFRQLESKLIQEAGRQSLSQLFSHLTVKIIILQPTFFQINFDKCSQVVLDLLQSAAILKIKLLKDTKQKLETKS